MKFNITEMAIETMLRFRKLIRLIPIMRKFNIILLYIDMCVCVLIYMIMNSKAAYVCLIRHSKCKAITVLFSAYRSTNGSSENGIFIKSRRY